MSPGGRDRRVARAVGPWALWLGLVLVAGCGSRVSSSPPATAPAAARAATDDPASADAPPQEVSVSDPGSFTDGPLVQPADALLTWLQGTGGKRVRLPVWVSYNPIGVTGATVGFGGLGVRLDTSALSMTLPQHLQRHCGDANPCAVWLEGTWGALVSALPGPGGGGPTLAVREVLGPVQDGVELRASVQAP